MHEKSVENRQVTMQKVTQATIDEVSKKVDDVKTGLLYLARDKPEGNLFIGQAASGTEMARVA